MLYRCLQSVTALLSHRHTPLITLLCENTTRDTPYTLILHLDSNNSIHEELNVNNNLSHLNCCVKFNQPPHHWTNYYFSFTALLCLHMGIPRAGTGFRPDPKKPEPKFPGPSSARPNLRAYKLGPSPAQPDKPGPI
jgi:hypothetical protein